MSGAPQPLNPRLVVQNVTEVTDLVGVLQDTLARFLPFKRPQVFHTRSHLDLSANGKVSFCSPFQADHRLNGFGYWEVMMMMMMMMLMMMVVLTIVMMMTVVMMMLIRMRIMIRMMRRPK